MTVLLPSGAEKRDAVVGELVNDDDERPASPTESSEGGRILIVDDESDVRDVLARLVRRMGYEVVFARDGIQALDVERTQTLAGMLVDVAMPELDGFSVLEELRQRRSQVPVVLISGYSNQSRRLAERADPRAEFLQKPFSASSLSRALDRVGVQNRERVTPRV